ncbi:DUF4260 domain-containing protein [Mucilaginibacter sp. CSA2-8R]|uniref:DUF4260 domain-containing protein n=1 Tax=Mucilaginibacter sp. CSA2-8R TaxID=3141542 RepID=UPI00315CC522
MNTIKSMAITLQAEEAAITALAIYGLTSLDLHLPLWAWVLLFFAPDLSMLGYLAGTRTGAFTYNLFHHRAVAVAITAAGIVLHHDAVIAGGLLLFAHSSFDRMMGFGLKYPDSFKNTHLGKMQQPALLP